MKSAFRRPEALLRYLGLEVSDADGCPDFAMLVPRSFADRMRCDLFDPLLRQVLPLMEENQPAPGFVNDPLAEGGGQHDFMRAPGVIQKYSKRALIIASPSCAVHCRYCFRRHFPYEDHRSPQHRVAVDTIARDPSITEVILSGGDPLLLPDRPLQDLIRQLNQVGHVERIRIHTRIPIVLPERITQALLDTIQTSRAAIVVVTHANHPAELDADTARAMVCLKASGAWLLNQSVLLRGVNDSSDIQIELAHRLFVQHILPYYLHLLDPVSGSHHFFVERTKALAIHRAIQAQLPGYLLPRLVEEKPGAQSKTTVCTGSCVQ